MEWFDEYAMQVVVTLAVLVFADLVAIWATLEAQRNEYTVYVLSLSQVRRTGVAHACGTDATGADVGQQATKG